MDQSPDIWSNRQKIVNFSRTQGIGVGDRSRKMVLSRSFDAWSRFAHHCFEPVFGIWICMFLGLPNPDPLVRGIDPDPFLINGLSGLQYCMQNKILTKDFSKKLNFLDLR
jgi:hypothetical protein